MALGMHSWKETMAALGFSCCLCRSVCNKSILIHDLIANESTDVAYITEKWVGLDRFPLHRYSTQVLDFVSVVTPGDGRWATTILY